MRTKAYSTRLRVGDDLDEEIILRLDDLDQQGEDSGEWLREAARMRILAESTQEIESAPVKEVAVADPISLFSNLSNSEEAIDLAIEAIFNHLTEEQKLNYMRKALEYRVAKKFVDIWTQSEKKNTQNEEGVDRANTNAASDVFLPNEGTNREVHLEALQGAPEGPGSDLDEAAAQGSSEGPIENLDDGFGVYREALPDLLRLELMERG